jgi:hypothetical protein
MQKVVKEAIQGQADKRKHVSPHNKQAAFEQRTNPNQHYSRNLSKYIYLSNFTAKITA